MNDEVIHFFIDTWEAKQIAPHALIFNTFFHPQRLVKIDSPTYDWNALWKWSTIKVSARFDGVVFKFIEIML